MSSFYSILSSENYKTKRRYGLTLSLVLPLILTGLAGILLFFMKYQMSGYNPWFELGKILFYMYAVFYPLYVVLICYLIADIEHQSHGFRLIFVLPATRLQLYASKAIIVLMWILSSVLAAIAGFYLIAYLLNFLNPDFHFEEYNNNKLVISYFIKLLVSSCALSAIHLSVSFFFNNFIKSVGVGVFLVITGLVVSFWGKNYLYPYSHSYQYVTDFTKFNEGIFTYHFYLAIIFCLLFYIAGYFIFARSE